MGLQLVFVINNQTIKVYGNAKLQETYAILKRIIIVAELHRKSQLPAAVCISE